MPRAAARAVWRRGGVAYRRFVAGLDRLDQISCARFLAGCAWLTYGRVQPAADDAVLYGFCIPAGLGVALWLFARIGHAPLRGVIVPVVAAHLWHLGVLVGLGGIFIGESTGFAWLEFPRVGAVLLFFGYLLLAFVGHDEFLRAQ
ncbi:MAG: hypothetical protein WDM76_14545 [Limisphaerales bacterium]